MRKFRIFKITYINKYVNKNQDMYILTTNSYIMNKKFDNKLLEINNKRID